ncbi:hypothetical protein SBI_07750 [Streptomyces bingchenggensis BCW-1]|uniref:Uncharacterized protein n=1 Tax=Streptomyces bingchenggensis (strain BCW-1) TaxID=749414 RepID=D7CD23_STRBB|nr:hypothetical protein SBI_07750 [Streptomyces bingchenggensis BCW-1]
MWGSGVTGKAVWFALAPPMLARRQRRAGNRLLGFRVMSS